VASDQEQLHQVVHAQRNMVSCIIIIIIVIIIIIINHQPSTINHQPSAVNRQPSTSTITITITTVNINVTSTLNTKGSLNSRTSNTTLPCISSLFTLSLESPVHWDPNSEQGLPGQSPKRCSWETACSAAHP
jgi:hypothetical protein